MPSVWDEDQAPRADGVPCSYLRRWERAFGRAERQTCISGHENESRGLLFGFRPRYGRPTGTGASQGERMVGRPFVDDGRVEPELFSGCPCDLSGCAASADPSVSFALCVSRVW
jgi:hypothetical protein